MHRLVSASPIDRMRGTTHTEYLSTLSGRGHASLSSTLDDQVSDLRRSKTEGLVLRLKRLDIRMVKLMATHQRHTVGRVEGLVIAARLASRRLISSLQSSGSFPMLSR